jgi:hypothetical protein
MGSNPNHLHLTFISPYSKGYDPFSDRMAAYLKPVVIDDVPHFVRTVLAEVARTRKKIGSITFISHAGYGEIWIGRQNVTLVDLWATKVSGKTRTPLMLELAKINPHFVPDADIVFLECFSAYFLDAISALSLVWPSTRIFAWTGKIQAYENGYAPEGVVYSCRVGGCS